MINKIPMRDWPVNRTRIPHDDDIQILRFAMAMQLRMFDKRLDGKRGWDTDALNDNDLQILFERIVIGNGEILDAANYLMMMYQRGVDNIGSTVHANKDTLPLLEKIGSHLHYPEHWDKAAYPTIYDAMYEVLSDYQCNQCQQGCEDEGCPHYGTAHSHPNEPAPIPQAAIDKANTALVGMNDQPQWKKALIASLTSNTLADMAVAVGITEGMTERDIISAKHDLNLGPELIANIQQWHLDFMAAK